MLLYRAINLDDINNLKNKKHIYCSLANYYYSNLKYSSNKNKSNFMLDLRDSSLSQTSKNDLLMIEKDNNIYIHDFRKNGYYNQNLGEQIIDTKEVVKIINKKKKLVKIG